jgi:hypothetical protein
MDVADAMTWKKKRPDAVPVSNIHFVFSGI